MAYDIVIGAPFLRLMSDGEVVNAYGKPLHFRKDGTTTTFIGGRVRRVSRADICRCVAEGIDINTLYPKHAASPPPSKRAILRRYGDFNKVISLCVNAIITENGDMLLLHLYERVPAYIAHFKYIAMAEDDLRDVICACIIALVGDIVNCKRTVIAPDRYIIRMVRQYLAEHKIEYFEKKSLIDFM